MDGGVVVTLRNRMRLRNVRPGNLFIALFDEASVSRGSRGPNTGKLFPKGKSRTLGEQVVALAGVAHQ